MNGMRHVRGMADVRTIIGTHGRSAPRRGRQGYLDAYLLSREVKRLEEEIADLHRRRERAEGRLGETRLALAQMLSECGERFLVLEPATQIEPGDTPPGEPPAHGGPPAKGSRTMTIAY